jgi:hypothetical protein
MLKLRGRVPMNVARGLFFPEVFLRRGFERPVFTNELMDQVCCHCQLCRRIDGSDQHGLV